MELQLTSPLIKIKVIYIHLLIELFLLKAIKNDAIQNLPPPPLQLYIDIYKAFDGVSRQESSITTDEDDLHRAFDSLASWLGSPGSPLTNWRWNRGKNQHIFFSYKLLFGL